MSKQEEIKENVKINTIESLITAGIENIVPVTVSYLGEEYAVDIRPLSTNQMNRINQEFLRSKKTTNIIIKNGGDTKVCRPGLNSVR